MSRKSTSAVALPTEAIAVDPVDELEKDPRRGRHEHADERGEDEEHAVLPAPDDRARVDGRARGIAHALAPRVSPAVAAASGIREIIPDLRIGNKGRLGMLTRVNHAVVGGRHLAPTRRKRKFHACARLPTPPLESAQC
jgi:hypothetical protein